MIGIILTTALFIIASDAFYLLCCCCCRRFRKYTVEGFEKQANTYHKKQFGTTAVMPPKMVEVRQSYTIPADYIYYALYLIPNM